MIAVLLVSPTLYAQAPAGVQPRPEVAAEYTYVHSNAPPGGCGGFNINGGSASVAQPFRSGRISFAFDATFGQSTGVASSDGQVTLSTFTAGVRYRPIKRGKWSPFGEVLVGVSHAAGSLTNAPNPSAGDAALVFAGNFGGGVDRRINEHWSLRIVEADYLLTTFDNGTNDHQNNLRLSTGAVYRFGKH